MRDQIIDSGKSLGAALAVLTGVTQTVSAQYFLIPDISGDHIMQVSRTDGSIINPNYIDDDLTSVNYDFRNPWDVIQVGGQIWVSDFTSDQLIRFDSFGNWIATISVGVDALRGMALASNGNIYVCNNGSQHQAPGNAVIAFNSSGVKLFHFAVNAPADVLERNGELLVSNSLNHDIERYSFTGTYLGAFHASTGVSAINIPGQLASIAAGKVLAAGTSGAFTQGIYEYSSVGAQANFWNIGAAPQGVAELDNGDILFADGTGLHIYVRSTGIVSDVLTGFAAQFINPFGPPPPPTVYCTSGTSVHGCVPQISATGVPSASAGSGFNISVSLSEGQSTSIIFYGVNGRFIQPWAIGGTSFFCVKTPLQRTVFMNSGGSLNTCSGTFGVDWATYVVAHPNALGHPFFSGQLVQAQGWYRDAGSPKTTSLSAALEFTVQP